MINKGKIFLRGNFLEGASGLICRKICPKTEILTGVDGQLLILLIATPIKIDVQHEFFVQKERRGEKNFDAQKWRKNAICLDLHL